MRKLRMLLAALLITVFIMPYSSARAESSETPANMSIDIVQNSTEITVGETATASWTYAAALPLEDYSVQIYMFNFDDTYETILVTSDQSVSSFSYTPSKTGLISLSIYVKGADGRSLSNYALWTVTGDDMPGILIEHGSTEVAVGETIWASWTYSAALPLEDCSIQLFMFNDDDTTETILVTSDPSVTSFSYTPTQAGQLSLEVYIQGADGRKSNESVLWTITGDDTLQEVVPMSIDIVQDCTEAAVGETISASWTYSAALPLEYYNIEIFMFNADDTAETILTELDPSVTSFSYTPTQAGQLSLSIIIYGADGRSLSKTAQWTITEGTVPPKVPGDANGDGAVSLDDAVAILVHLADSNTDVNLRNADINGDGKVNIQDVLLLLQQAAGWN